MAVCPNHETVQDRLESHEQRLRDKRDRILKLELEAAHMREQMDLIVRQGAEIKTSLDSLKQWQLYLMGGAGALAVAYSVVSSHWQTIVRIFGGGA